MKTTISAYIEKAVRESGDVIFTINGRGKTDTPNISGQAAEFSGTLKLKAIVANKIPLGSTLTITISDEKQSE